MKLTRKSEFLFDEIEINIEVEESSQTEQRGVFISCSQSGEVEIGLKGGKSK